MKKKICLFFILVALSSSLFAQQATGDPWIKKVFNVTWGRDPTAMEYNIKNYNDGHWNNYNELMNYIYEYRKNFDKSGITFKYSSKIVNNKVIVGVFQNGTQVAANLITNDGGSIVASGGGNIISINGNGIVASGGGNIVASGGGNIMVNSSTKGASFGSSSTYRTLSTGTPPVKTSGGGIFIIQ